MNPRTRRQVLFVGCSVLVLAVIAVLARPFFADAYERLSFSLAPSASKAMQYGESHFDAPGARSYDLPLAQFFFLQAARLDPNTPYVYHELARIAFLQGDFSQALALIDLQIMKHGDTEPNSYYVRGLIEGYMGNYADSAADYQHFLQFDPHDWAAKNDEVWVLLKAQKYTQALQLTDSGLADMPANPWLLNSKATALYELGEYQQALDAVQQASASVSKLTPESWSAAYPGNDPAIASEGLATFKSAVADNIHTIERALATNAVQSK